jgi:hypothetical protein
MPDELPDSDDPPLCGRRFSTYMSPGPRSQKIGLLRLGPRCARPPDLRPRNARPPVPDHASPGPQSRTTGPRDHGTTGPRDHGTTGPRDHGTTGPRDHASPGPSPGPRKPRPQSRTTQAQAPHARHTRATRHTRDQGSGIRDQGSGPSQLIIIIPKSIYPILDNPKSDERHPGRGPSFTLVLCPHGLREPDRSLVAPPLGGPGSRTPQRLPKATARHRLVAFMVSAARRARSGRTDA